MEWQLIETAPKDGKAVLVHRNIGPGTESGFSEECNGHNTYVAEWWDNDRGGGKWMLYTDQIEEPECPIDPTHWMPLPDIPK